MFSNKYVFTPKLLYQEQDVTLSQFLSRLNLVWIQKFPFSQISFLIKAKNPVFPIIFL